MNNCKSPIKFAFRKVRPDRWDKNPTVCHIVFRKNMVGWIENRDNLFRIVLRKNASEVQLAKNPNCKWGWGTLSKSFASPEDAKEFIQNNNKLIFECLYDGIKDGTDL